MLSLAVLRIAGWMVLHVVCRTLWGVGAGYGTVLLRDEPGARSGLWRCEASARKEEEDVLEGVQTEPLLHHQRVHVTLPGGTLGDSGLLIVCSWTPMHLILRDLVLLYHRLLQRI